MDGETKYDNHPKLRALDVRPITHEGAPYYLLRDPQKLTEHQLLVPSPLAAVLNFCDGAHDVPAMRAAFAQRYRVELPEAVVHELLDALDAAVMLENERAAAARQAAVDAYRSAPCREPALAGLSYPADDRALWRLLQDYLEGAEGVEPAAIDWSQPVGLLSPHIDYPRGGPVYAQVWKRAAQAAREAELVVLLGTDHYGGDLFTLTRQSYATPYGTLPTDTALVDKLAAAIGEEAAFAGELRHRGEHSLELVAVWLHHLRAGNPVPVVPVLTGSFHPFLNGAAEPHTDATVRAFLDALAPELCGRRVLVIASGDLAHVGPAFGGRPLDDAGRARLAGADARLIAAMTAGDAGAFYDEIRSVHDRNNVCGVAPIYLALNLVGERPGAQYGYAVCPADERDTSVVTVTGMLFN